MILAFVVAAVVAVSPTQTRPQSPTLTETLEFIQGPIFQSCHPYNANPPPCSDSDASDNVPSDPYFGGTDHAVQFVPVGAGGGPGDKFYVAYSTKKGTSCNGGCGLRTFNVSMSVFELACTEPADVLIFGTGYGCTRQGGASCCLGAEFTPEHDAGLLDQIIRGCMRLAGTVKIDIVVPHAHRDHINPETVHALGNLGYTIRKIFVHVDDRALLESITSTNPPTDCSGADWTAGDLAKFVNFGTDDPQAGYIGSPECEQHWNTPGVKSFRTTLGRVWFQERDGHTAGSVDLVLDFNGNETDRYVVYGSVEPNTNANNCHDPSSTCPLPGVVWAVKAHDNFILP